MSDDKHKNIPTLEDVVEPGEKKPAAAEAVRASTTQAVAPASENKIKRDSAERRQDDRRKKQEPVAAGQAERRVDDRRTGPRRSIDQRRSEEMNELVEKIMQDMMPDLEQHLFLQLRFELQKHMPKILSEFKNKDGD
jgi:hypothetical protein